MTKFKKLMMVVLIGITLFSLTACTDSKDSSLNINGNTNTTENNKEETSDTDNYVKNLLYEIKMYADVLYGRRIEAADDSYVFHLGDEDVVILKYLGDEFTGTYKDILPALNTGKMWKEVDEQLDVIMPEDKDFFLTVDSETDVVVNGKQCRKITGNVTDEEGTKVLAYGYTFIHENIPFMIMGYVLEESQEEMPRLIEEVDRMVASLRHRGY